MNHKTIREKVTTAIFFFIIFANNYKNGLQSWEFNTMLTLENNIRVNLLPQQQFVAYNQKGKVLELGTKERE